MNPTADDVEAFIDNCCPLNNLAYDMSAYNYVYLVDA